MTRRWCLLPVVLTLSCLGLSAQNVYNLPQIADGLGVITTLIAFNNSNEAATVIVSLTDNNGDSLNINFPGLGNTTPYFFNLPAGETRFFESAGEGVGNQIGVGAGVVISTADIGISSVFSIFNGEDLLTEAGVGASDAVLDFALAVDTGGSLNTGIAIQDLSGSSNELTFTLFDQGPASSGNSTQGAPLQTTRTLPGDGHLSLFVGGPGGLFPGVSGRRARLVVNAEAEVAAVTLRQDSSGAPLTTLPIVTLDSSKTSFELPQIADGSLVTTQFIFFGLGGASPAGGGAGTVDLTLTDNAGAPYPVGLSNGQSGNVFSFPLGPSDALFVETDGQGSNLAGAAQVTSTIPIGVTAVFRLLDGSGGVSTEAGVGDSPPLDEFSLPFDLTSGFNTGVALFNNNPGTASVDVTLLSEGGQEITTLLRIAGLSMLRIPAGSSPLGLNGFNHQAQFLDEIVDGATGRGQAQFSSNLPISALGIRQGTGVLTTLPVDPGTGGGGGPGPGPGSELLPTLVEGINASGDTVHNQELETGFRLDGMVGPFGTFVNTVQARHSDGSTYGGRSDFQQNFRIIVPAGTADVAVCATQVSLEPGPVGIGGTSSLFVGVVEEDVPINGNTVRNVTVPAVATTPFSGTVANLQEIPEEGRNEGLSILFSDLTNMRSALASVDPVSGAFTGGLPSGTFNAGLIFSTDSSSQGEQFTFVRMVGSATLSESSISPSGGAFAVPDLVEVSGMLTADVGSFPQNTFVFASDSDSFSAEFLTNLCFASFGGAAGFVDSTGLYATTLQAGESFFLFSNLPIINVGEDEEGLWQTPVPGTKQKSFAVDSILHFNHPSTPGTSKIMGCVTGKGEPAIGVAVSASNRGVTQLFFCNLTESDLRRDSPVG